MELGRQLGTFLADEEPSTRMLGKADLEPIRVLSTGCIALDVASGVGGYPWGKVAILHGDESSGKTTLALLAVAECQKLGGVALYLDWEHKLDARYAAALGVDVENLIIGDPDYIEAGFKLLTRAAVHARTLDPDCPILFVWDSLQQADAKRTFESDWDASGYPPEAGAYSRGLRRFTTILDRMKAILLMINQVRVEIDGGFVPKQKVGVGKACGHAATIVIRLKNSRSKGSLAGPAEGDEVRAVFSKNQVAAPWKVATFTNIYGRGPERYGATLAAAEAVGIASPPSKKGQTWTLDFDTQLIDVKGPKGMEQFHTTHPAEFMALEIAIYRRIGVDARALLAKDTVER